MGGTHDISVISTDKSSLIPQRQSLQLLEQDAAAPCAMQIGTKSCEKWQKIAMVLMSLMQGLMEHTTNGDAVLLSTYRARQLCRQHGIEDDVIDEAIQRYLGFADRIRKNNPMAF
jgi:hypothetical protein